MYIYTRCTVQLGLGLGLGLLYGSATAVNESHHNRHHHCNRNKRSVNYCKEHRCPDTVVMNGSDM